MIKFALNRWDENNKKLREVIANTPVEERKNWDYADLVYLVATTVYEFELTHVHNIRYGGECNYQGTLVFLIPMDDSPFTEREWLMSYVGYGSCTVCDTLQSIQCDDGDPDSDIDAVDLYMNICRDIVSNTILPYNNGWRNDDLYNTVTVDDNDTKDNEDYTKEVKNTDADGTHIRSMLEEYADKFGLKMPKDCVDDETDQWDVDAISFVAYREFVLVPILQTLQSAMTENTSTEEREKIVNLIDTILNQWNDATQAFLKHENVDENVKNLYKLMWSISNVMRRSLQKDPMSNMVSEFYREFDKEGVYQTTMACNELDEIEKSCIDPMIKALQGNIASISDLDTKTILNNRINRITAMWTDIKKDVLSHKIQMGEIKSVDARYSVMNGGDRNVERSDK